MSKLNFAEEYQVVPLLAHADIVATAAVTRYVKLGNIGRGQLEIEVNFGALTTTDSTGEVVVTVVGNDTNDTSTSDNNEVAAAFGYRLSGAVGTDAMGAITQASATGAVVANTDDNKSLLIYVDPAVIGQKYVRAVITPTADLTSTIVGAVARFIPRKAQNAQPSSS